MLNKIETIFKNVFSQTIWKKIRQKKILKQHKKVADFWHPIINSYFDGNIEKYNLLPKKKFADKKIIWQYWGQGIEGNDLPEIVRICFESVDRHKGDYTVIRLSDSTISEYIDLPDFVWEKRNNQSFTRTFFSDLLRVALLSAYGGVWLDATILLTDKLPRKYAEMDYFMFQRSDEELHKRYWENVYAYYFSWHPQFKVKMLSSILFAKKESAIVAVLLDLMLYYWKTQDQLFDYFVFQILYNELITGKLSQQNCPIINDCIPHIIQTKINGTYDYASFEDAMNLTPMHKMAYFDEMGVKKLKEVISIHK